ncbi:tetratricopeptide repeat protein [Brevundimonas balnearis]|uniref:Tetratricopeptide repeat protein n=1 Tax=Brevundimonas balnearis TaxID=1572858 RepID=A0ABV6QYI9_9CAUL
MDVRAREALTRGNTARDAGRHQEAAEHFAVFCRLKPERTDIQLQLGNMWLETARFEEAALIYRHVLAQTPTFDAWLQLGRALLGLGLVEQAVAALQEAWRLKPGDPAVRAAVIAVGAGALLREDGADPSHAFETWRLGARLKDLQDRLSELDSGPVGQRSDYDAYRHRLVAPEPPRSGPWPPLEVLIDAVGASPYALQETLQSVREQVPEPLAIHLFADDALRTHPVATLAASTPRLSFAPPVLNAATSEAHALLCVGAGVVLEAGAVGWLVHAMRDGVEVVYADADRSVIDQQGRVAHFDPRFWPCADPLDMETSPTAPDLLLVRGGAATDLVTRLVQGLDGGEARRGVALAALKDGRAVNVPLLLSSVRGLPIGADQARPDEPVRTPPARGDGRVGKGRGRIRVIIPTRDHGRMTRTAVEALLGRARERARLSIVVIDNGSTSSDTLDELRALAELGVEVKRIDEPFNWGRLNNLAVEGVDDGRLIFANDDTEMLTPGWDELILDVLSKPGVGAAGVRLLYPDHTLQHAGVLLGFGATEVLHEGLRAPAEASGPDGRWKRTRCAAAVTGAFLATTSRVFHDLGGFNTRDFAIGYSDIDFCLRVRSAGGLVAYVGEVEAIHHESKTRGLNHTLSRAAFDQSELLAFRRLWDGAVSDDPSLNPHIARTDAHLESLRPVNIDMVERHLERVASSSPWRPRASI